MVRCDRLFPRDPAHLLFAAALQDDDADSDDDEAEKEARRKEAIVEQRERENARGVAKQNTLEKQPTGKVVGIIKRSWRPWVRPCPPVRPG